MSRFTIGNYYPGSSLIHRLDPRLKLIISVAMMIIIFMLNSWWQLLIYAVFLFGCQALSGLPPRLLLRSMRPILWIAIFAFIINTFSIPGTELFSVGPVTVTEEGVFTGLRMVVRLVLLIVTSTLFLTLTTTPLLLADSLESLLGPLKRLKVPVHDLSMMMSIALRFVPTLSEEADKIMKAQSSRGANYDSGKLLDRLKGIISILVPLFVSAIGRAEDLALAMEARCYRGGEGRTKLHELHYSRLDAAFAAVFVLLLASLWAAGRYL